MGAFIFAASGRLDGRKATTHWLFAPRMQEMFPSVRVEGDRIFLNDDGIWTSAGMTAGIDVTLALIEEDLGAAVARKVARMMVVYYRLWWGKCNILPCSTWIPARIRSVKS